ncbi:MAG: hypothetical protein HN919_03030 [Verrucomicrobia bacterium]|nr:hypothetical protein [Verrucomicrobiota bacterium]
MRPCLSVFVRVLSLAALLPGLLGAEPAAPATPADKLRTLEAQQGAEARKMGKVAGDVSWLLEELESNDLFKYGGGKNLQALQVAVSSVADERLPAVALHLRDARLEADAARHHMSSARQEVDAIVKELQRVLAGSSALLMQEALIQEIKDMIKVQGNLRSGTAEWTKALLINPELAGAGKGPLIQGQRAMLARYGRFLELLRKARVEAFDEASRSRFKQAEEVLSPAPPDTESAAVQQLLEPPPTVADFLESAIKQIERSDGLAAAGAQDRVIDLFKGALQLLSAGRFDFGEFVAGLELLLEKQRVLRKDTGREAELEKNSSFYEARQVEIQDAMTDFAFDAPDLFVSKKGEYLVEPLMIAFEEAVDAIKAAKKEDAVAAQERVIALLESVYGSVLEKEGEAEEGEGAEWTFHPVIPEDRYKLPPDGDEEDAGKPDPDMPDIFEGPEAAALMIQPEGMAEGAMPEVQTMTAANLFLGLEDDEEEDSEPPPFVTDEGPPQAGSDKDAADDAGGRGESNTDAVEVDRLADSAMERKRQKAKIQDYVRQLPPEFRRQVADYYEVIGE